VFKRLFPNLANLPPEKWLAMPGIGLLVFAYVASVLGRLFDPN